VDTVGALPSCVDLDYYSGVTNELGEENQAYITLHFMPTSNTDRTIAYYYVYRVGEGWMPHAVYASRSCSGAIQPPIEPFLYEDRNDELWMLVEEPEFINHCPFEVCTDCLSEQELFIWGQMFITTTALVQQHANVFMTLAGACSTLANDTPYAALLSSISSEYSFSCHFINGGGRIIFTPLVPNRRAFVFTYGMNIIDEAPIVNGIKYVSVQCTPTIIPPISIYYGLGPGSGYEDNLDFITEGCYECQSCFDECDLRIILHLSLVQDYLVSFSPAPPISYEDVQGWVGQPPGCATSLLTSGLVDWVNGTTPFIRLVLESSTSGRTFVLFAVRNNNQQAWVDFIQLYSNQCGAGAAPPPEYPIPNGTYEGYTEGPTEPLQSNCEPFCDLQVPEWLRHEEQAVVTLAYQARYELDAWASTDTDVPISVFRSPYTAEPSLNAPTSGAYPYQLPLDETAPQLPVFAGAYSYYKPNPPLQRTINSGGNTFLVREIIATPVYGGINAYYLCVVRKITNNGGNHASDLFYKIFRSTDSGPNIPTDAHIVADSITNSPFYTVTAFMWYNANASTRFSALFPETIGGIGADARPLAFASRECELLTMLYALRQTSVYKIDTGDQTEFNFAVAQWQANNGTFIDPISGIKFIYPACVQLQFRAAGITFNELTNYYGATQTAYPNGSFESLLMVASSLWTGISDWMGGSLRPPACTGSEFSAVLALLSNNPWSPGRTTADYDNLHIPNITQFLDAYSPFADVDQTVTFTDANGNVETMRYLYENNRPTIVFRYVKRPDNSFLVPPTLTRTLDAPNVQPQFLHDYVVDSQYKAFPPNETTNLAGYFTLNKL
jgi:hypothetical protein